MEENHTLKIRALDPLTEIELFREAYSWRPKGKKYLQPHPMDFEDFAANDPNQIVMGLFNGKLCAVFMFREFQPGWLETHFTTRRDAQKDNVLLGALTLADWCVERRFGLTANIVERNTPLRRFVEAIGFQEVEHFEYQGKPYVRYARNVNAAAMVA